MAAPPLRTEISDTYPNPSNAAARAGFGKLWDYVTGLLGATGNAPEARTALGFPSTVAGDARKLLAVNAAGDGFDLFDPPAFSAYYSGTLTFPATTTAKVPLNATHFDSHTAFNLSGNRYVAAVAGYYHFDGRFSSNATGTDRVIAFLYKNNLEQFRGSDAYLGGTNPKIGYTSVVSGLMYLDVGDYVELFGFAGAAYGMPSGAAVIGMTGHLVRAA